MIAVDLLLFRCRNELYSIFVATTAKEKQIGEAERMNGTRTLEQGARRCNVYPVVCSVSSRCRIPPPRSRS